MGSAMLLGTTASSASDTPLGVVMRLSALGEQMPLHIPDLGTAGRISALGLCSNIEQTRHFVIRAWSKRSLHAMMADQQAFPSKHARKRFSRVIVLSRCYEPRAVPPPVP